MRHDHVGVEIYLLIDICVLVYVGLAYQTYVPVLYLGYKKQNPYGAGPVQRRPISSSVMSDA